LPPGYRAGITPVPVIIGLHGAGGSAAGFAAITCAGDFRGLGVRPAFSDGSCLHKMASEYLVVYPNGEPAKTGNPRAHAWDAGGGKEIGGVRYVCTSELRAGACTQPQSLERPYFEALLQDLKKRFAIDERRIFITGISNGAAMSYRLACDFPGRFAAIAAVAGTNQYAVDMARGAPCGNAQRPTPALQIHGNADPIWPLEGGPGAPSSAAFVSVRQALFGFGGQPGWVQQNGCRLTSTTILPDRVVGDGSQLAGRPGEAGQRQDFGDCAAPVVLVTLFGAGHTWPSGWQYFPIRRIGFTNRDYSANRLILDFFASIAKGTGAAPASRGPRE
jgi:poly(3-hydroxybutyrate) depolymerase